MQLILTRAFASSSRAHVMQLKTSLTKASIGFRSVSDYVNHVKALADELSLIDTAIKDDDLTLYIVNGLGPAYRDLVSAIRTRENPFRFEELRDRLIEHELYLKRTESESAQLVATANVAQSAPSPTQQPRNSDNRGSGQYRGRGRGRGGSHYGGRSGGGRSYNSISYHNNNRSSVICQLCGYYGHTAPSCRRPPPAAHHAYSSGHNYSPQPSHFPPPQNSWLMDTGASHSVTNDLSNLSIHSEYAGTDEIQTANGTGSQYGGSVDQRAIP